MTAQETHPGLLAIDQQAKFMARRSRAKDLREKAASLRREAKATKLSVDAAQLRREAKPLTEEAYGLELEAKAYKKEVVAHTAAATELLNKRMPPRVLYLGNHENARLHQSAGRAGCPRQAHSPQSRSCHPSHSAAADAQRLE